MQGAFPGGTNWARALDPDPDEAAQTKAQSDQIHRQLLHLTHLRDGAAPPNPGTSILDYQPGKVFPPTAKFQVAGKTFYILKDLPISTQEARPGIWGHYLVTTVQIQKYPYSARPIMASEKLPRADRVNDLGNGFPGQDPTDKRYRPSRKFCRPNIDYITPFAVNGQPGYYEIGYSALKTSLEKAEALDLAFARRMEGLGNVAAQVCWDCLDPDYNPSDRPAVMEQFMAKYLARFYDGVDPELGPSSEMVSDEALHKHKSFCQAWVRKHYKTLTPAVTSPADTLVSEFYPHIAVWFTQTTLTRTELARVLMRLEDTTVEFANCLHFYASSLEQARGGRNASYKQMTTVSTFRAMSHKRFGDLLGAKAEILRDVINEIGSSHHNRTFHPLVVDWYNILGQMPQAHRFFMNKNFAQSLIKRPRRDARVEAHVPPWRTMRNAA